MDASYYKTLKRRKTSYKTRTARAGRNEPQKDWQARVLLQCIVSSGILCFILIICMVNTGLTNNIRANLKSAISSGTTTSEVRENIGQATGAFLVLQDSIRSFFGKEDEPEPAAATEAETPEGQEGSPEATGSQDFRIDEDILSELQNQPDPYMERNIQ